MGTRGPGAPGEVDAHRRQTLLEHLTAFDEVVAKLSSWDIVRGALEFIRDRLGTFRISVSLVDAGRLHFHVLDAGSPTIPVREDAPFPLQETILSTLFDRGDPLYRRDIASEPRRWPRDERILAAGVRSAFLLPLVSSGAPFGALVASSNRVDGFPEEDRRVLALLAPRLALALQNALLFEELQAGEQRYRSIFRAVPVAIWEEDCSAIRAAGARLRASGVEDLRRYAAEHPDFIPELARTIRVLDVNEAAVSLYGARTREELLGGLEPFLLPESYPALAEALLTVAEGREYFECETVNRTLRGERLDVLMRITFPAPTAEAGKAIVSVLDLTRRKEVERALQRRIEFDELVTALSTRFINLPPEGIDGGIREALEAIGRFASADRSYVFLFSEGAKRVEQVFSWCVPGLEPDLGKWVGATEDVLPWFAQVVRERQPVTLWDPGELPPAAAKEREILERRGVKSLVTRPLVFRGEPLGYIGMDTLGAKKAWPPDVLSLLELVGQMVVSAVERKRAEEAVRLAREELEVRVRERTADLELAKAALEEDIAARRRAESEKAQLERQLRRSRVLEAVGLLAGGVAHDFNNILGSVIGCLYIAKLHIPEESPVREELERAQALCKRGGELTRQLLTLARRRTGTVESIDLAPVLEDVQVLLGRTLPKNILFTIRQAESLPPVRGDRSMLTSALLNLGINARDAMPHGGELTITVENAVPRGRSSRVVIQVADTGVGIPEAVQDRVFDPFFTTKAPGEGTGLGLAMVYAAVAESGGKITLRSEPDRGSSFRLELPAAGRPRRLGRAPTPGKRSRHPLTAAKILVVEDEENVARLVLQILGARGYSALWAKTGIVALETVRDYREELGLVVLDLLLPELGGEEVYRLLKDLTPEVPILLITGREDLATSLAPGARLLAKPFTAQEFLAGVREALTEKGWG